MASRKPRVRSKRRVDPVAAALGGPIADRGGSIKNLKPSHDVRKPDTSRLAASVARERAKVRAGTSKLAADTGDVIKDTKVLPGERKRARKAAHRAALRSAPRKTSGIEKIGEVLVKGGKLGDEIAGVAKRGAEDIIKLPVTIAQGAFETSAAAYEFSKGDNRRGKALLKGFVEHDPLALAAQGKLKEAGQEIYEHPGLFAVEVAGVKGSVGHKVTKAQERRGVVGRLLPGEAKNPTAREPARDPVTQFAVKRQYSRDPINRAVQRRRERRQVTEAEAMRVKADAMEREGNAAEAVDQLRHDANKLDPRVASAKQAKVAAARAHDVGKIISERHAGALDKAVKAAMGNKPTAAITLRAQRIADGSVASLQAHRARLRAAADSGKLDAADLAANRKARRDIDAAIKQAADPKSVREASARVESILRPLQARLVEEGILAAPRARKSPLVGYAVTQMEGVRHSKRGPVRDVEGKARPVKVKAAEIEAHMAARGIEPGVYISQRAPRVAGGPGSQSGASRITGASRSGRAVEVGTADLSPDNIRRTALTQQKLIDYADAYKSKLRQFGADVNLKRPAAVKYAASMTARHGQEYVVIPRLPFAGDKDVARMAAEGADMESAAVKETIAKSIEGAFDGRGPEDGDYTVMSKAAADELRAQAIADIPKGPVGTAFKAASVHFSRNVLSTSPSWITGNFVEGQVRSWFAGTRPGDAKAFRKVVAEMRKIDPRLADELQAYGSGAGHHGSAGRLEHGNFLAAYDKTAAAGIAHRLEDFWKRPGPATAAKAWNAYTDFMFRTVSGRLESNFQASMSGALIRKSGIVDPRLPRLSEKAIDQAVRGLINTPEQAALGEALGHMFGRYSGRTADAKWAITTYTPFANWALSAADFVFRVLPRDHPTVVALAAAMDNATRDLVDNDALPDWLRGSIALGKGEGRLRISRYLPFGAFTSPSTTFETLFIPQFASSLKALQGEDWKGKKLYDKDGEPIDEMGRAGYAAQAFLEGTIPFFSKIKQVAEKGPGSIVKSTVGYVKPQEPKSSGGTSSSGSGDVFDELILDDGSDTLDSAPGSDVFDELILGE